MEKGFGDTFIGIRHTQIFPNHRDPGPVLGMNHPANELLPVAQIGGRCLEMKMGQHQLIEPLPVEHEGDLVNGVFDVLLLDHRLHRDVAEAGDFLAGFPVHRVFAPADENLRLDTDLAEFGDTLLGGLGLQFTRCLDEGHEGDVDEKAVPRSGLQRKLTQSFKEG